MMRHLMLCVGAAVFCAVPRIAAARVAGVLLEGLAEFTRTPEDEP